MLRLIHTGKLAMRLRCCTGKPSTMCLRTARPLLYDNLWIPSMKRPCSLTFPSCTLGQPAGQFIVNSHRSCRVHVAQAWTTSVTLGHTSPGSTRLGRWASQSSAKPESYM